MGESLAILAFISFKKNEIELEEGIKNCELMNWQNKTNEFWHKYECLKQQERYNTEAKC